MTTLGDPRGDDRGAGVEPAGWPRVEAALQALRPTYTRALANLVAHPSTIGQETDAQRFIAALATEAGLETELWDVDPAVVARDPRSGKADGGEKPRPNVTATLRGTGGGRSLAVSGHVDVVPAEPLDLWVHDPWGGSIDGDRLYGRGALDMKGGLIAGLHAVHAIRAADIRLRGDVLYESVIEEECTGNGTLAARLRGPRVDGAIITEPSGAEYGAPDSREEIRIATPGVIWFELTVSGKPAYVGHAGRSVNAIDVAIGLIAALKSLPDEFNAAFRHPAFSNHPRPLTLNVGTISAGNWPSNVPLECRVGFRLSFPIGWTVAQAQDAVAARIAEACAGDPWLREHPPTIRYHGFRSTGWSIDADASIVQALAQSYRAVAPGEAGIAPAFGTADARFFGDDGIPAAFFGPLGANLHAPDEFVSLESCHLVARVVAHAILRWCA